MTKTYSEILNDEQLAVVTSLSRRLVERDSRIRELEAIVKRLPITADDVTGEMLDRIAHEVGCWPGAWDMVNPQDLVAAIIRVAKAEAEGDVW